jgi:DNA-binding XRE family transcriptional regulator
MPLSQGNIAANVRRLAGMHLVSMDKLAQYLEMSRPSLQAIVAVEPHHRSLPKAETALKLAEAFGISLNALYSETEECLREAIENFEHAPIREVVEAPTSDLAPGLTMLNELAEFKRAKRKASEQKKRKT